MRHLLQLSILSIIFSLNHVWAELSHLVELCEQQGHTYGSSLHGNTIDKKCFDLTKEKAMPQTHYYNKALDLEIHGYGNIISIKKEDQLYFISGPQSAFENISALYYHPKINRIFALVNNKKSIYIFHLRAGGNIAPLQTFEAPFLDQVDNLSYDPITGKLLLISKIDNRIYSYDINSNSQDSNKMLFGHHTQLESPLALAIDIHSHHIYIFDQETSSLLIFKRDNFGNIEPLEVKTLSPQISSQIQSLYYCEKNREIYFTDSDKNLHKLQIH